MKICHTYISILLVYSCYNAVSGQQAFFQNHHFSASFVNGYISDEKRVYHSVIDDYIKGVEFTLSRIPNGSRDWHYAYNFPENGFGFFYLNLGNSEQLGSLFAVNRFIDFNLVTKNRFDFDARTSLGVAYVNKKFDPGENTKNIFFSRNLNFFFDLNLSLEFLLVPAQQIFLNTGISIMHASNGETRLPNYGVSIFSYFAGITKKGITEYNIHKDVLMSDYKKINYSFTATYGLKEDWRWGSQKFKELSAEGNALLALTSKQFVAIGFNLFYDETLLSYSNHNLEPVEHNKDAITAGIHIGYEFNLSPLFIVLHCGYMVYSSENVGHSNYNLLGLRYLVYKNLFVCLYHKSHDVFYGDNMQFGMGIQF